MTITVCLILSLDGIKQQFAACWFLTETVFGKLTQRFSPYMPATFATEKFVTLE